jgi:hypothetical protein
MLHMLQVVHVCCKGLFPMFHLCFRMYVCFILMLHTFHSYVASVLSGYYVCFAMVFENFSGAFFFKCFICLRTYVASVASRRFKSKSGVASPSSLFYYSPRCLLLLRVPAGHPPPLTLPDADDVRGDARNLRQKRMRRTQAVPAWHARAKSGEGTGKKQDGAHMSGRGGAEEGAPTCTQVSRQRGAEGGAGSNIRV